MAASDFAATDGQRTSVAHALPLSLRGIGALSRSVPFRGQARAGVALARLRLRPGESYRTTSGMILDVDPYDYFQACMLLEIYCPGLIAMIRRFTRPGSVVIDAGAHFGYTAHVAARQTGPKGRVFAFECDPRLFALLARHVQFNASALNTYGLIRPVDSALADRSGMSLDLKVTDQLGWSSLSKAGVAEVAGAQSVTVTSIALDDFLSSESIDPADLSLIKIDVEGSESLVLDGMPFTLKRGHAVIIMEIVAARLERQGSSPRALCDRLNRVGYSAFVPKMRRFPRVSWRLERYDGSSDADVVFRKIDHE